MLCAICYSAHTGNGQRTRELTTTCNGRHRRAGNGFRPEESSKRGKCHCASHHEGQTSGQELLTQCFHRIILLFIGFFRCFYRPNGQFGYLLNINGSTGSAYQGRALNLMQTSTMGTDQNFLIGTRSGYTGYYMMVTANVNYAVNRSDSNGRAIIWPLSTGSADSRLYDNSESVIRLYYSRELLTAREPIGPWSTVYFGGSGISVWVRVN